MQKRTTSLLIAAVVAIIVGLVPAMTVEARGTADHETASGTLVRVDTDNHTISIRTTAGAEMVFSFDDQTAVEGDEQTVAGLATMSGTDVTVHYTKKGDTNLAARIEVKKKSA
jgi:hypothetical protein